MIAFFILGKKSQNGSARGLSDGHLMPCSSKPNCVCSEQDKSIAMKDNSKAMIAPLEMSWDQLVKRIGSQGGTITHNDGGYLSAVFTSKLFKFTDDLEARKDGDIIHIRSSSRVGYSDRGVNRKRVEKLRAGL